MERTPNPYQVLGVSSTASLPEIQKAFRRLAFEWHPDRHPRRPHCEIRFREIVSAYRALRRTHRSSARAVSAPAEVPTWAIVPRGRRAPVELRWPARARLRLARTLARHGVILTLLFSAGSAMAITALGLHEPRDTRAASASMVDREELLFLTSRESRFAPVDSSVSQDLSTHRD
jgi:hypothetical protein